MGGYKSINYLKIKFHGSHQFGFSLRRTPVRQSTKSFHKTKTLAERSQMPLLWSNASERLFPAGILPRKRRCDSCKELFSESDVKVGDYSNLSLIMMITGGIIAAAFLIWIHVLYWFPKPIKRTT